MQISYNEHITRHILQLSNELKDKILVYLDLNFWILLRDCYNGKSKSDKGLVFFNKLKSLVESGRLLCPINHSIFIELLKQNDLESRINTARIIDIFSNATSMIFEINRENYELQYYVRKKLLNDEYISPVFSKVWTKMPYVMGQYIPENDSIDKSTLEQIQIEFFNYLWDLKLESMIEVINIGGNIPPSSFEKTADNINYGKSLFNNLHKSINSLFKTELKGGLSVYQEQFEKFLIWFNSTYPKLNSKLKKEIGIDSAEKLSEKIESDILKNQIDLYLPNIYINTCLYTAVRWDSKRNFKPNDFFDFQHSRAALPYYNYFFTERPLKHLLETKPYELDKKYNCIVESDIDKINTILTNLAS